MNFVFSCSLFVQFYFGNSLSLFFSFTIFFSYKQIQIIWLILHFSRNYLPTQKKNCPIICIHVYVYNFSVTLFHMVFIPLQIIYFARSIYYYYYFFSLLSSFLSFNYSTVTFLPYVVVV